jgi:hypothetical protein
MLSLLQSNLLNQAQKWLIGLISLSAILLAVSIVCLKNERSLIRLAEPQFIDYSRTLKRSKGITSLAPLLKTPQRYDKKYVRVAGYLNLEFEGNALYLQKRDYDQHTIGKCFWVNFSDQLIKDKQLASYSGRYVILDGVFDMASKGHMGVFAGEIQQINRLVLLKN